METSENTLLNNKVIKIRIPNVRLIALGVDEVSANPLPPPSYLQTENSLYFHFLFERSLSPGSICSPAGSKNRSKRKLKRTPNDLQIKSDSKPLGAVVQSGRCCNVCACVFIGKRAALRFSQLGKHVFTFSSLANLS